MKLIVFIAVVLGTAYGTMVKNCEERIEEYRAAGISLSRCNWDSNLCQACISVNDSGTVNVTEIFNKKCVSSEDGQTAVACHPDYKGRYWYRDFCVKARSKSFKLPQGELKQKLSPVFTSHCFTFSPYRSGNICRLCIIDGQV